MGLMCAVPKRGDRFVMGIQLSSPPAVAPREAAADDATDVPVRLGASAAIQRPPFEKLGISHILDDGHDCLLVKSSPICAAVFADCTISNRLLGGGEPVTAEVLARWDGGSTGEDGRVICALAVAPAPW